MANCVQCGRNLPPFRFGKKLCQWCIRHEAAQRGEEPEDAVQRVEVPPWLRSESSSMIVTQALFAINVIVFVAMAFAGASITEPTGQDLVRFGANFSPYTIDGQWWRLLSCVFVHIGIMHIAFNMWCLWDLGRLAESLYGHWTFGAIYLISGIAASVASTGWHPTGLSAGASGAIFGIAGALIASYYLGEFSLPRAAIAGTLRSLVFFAGYNLVFGAIWGRIDNAAHVGGLVSGLILGALIARVAPSGDEPWRRVGVLLAMALLVVGSFSWLERSRAYLFSTNRARQSLAEGKADEAIPRLEAVVRQHPEFLPARMELARAYAIKRDYAKAEAELKRLVAQKPNDENVFYILGFTELELKRPQQAREAFAQLLELDPKSSDAHFGMAAAFASENKYAEALTEYSQTAQLDPEYQNVFYNIGLMQINLKQYDEAIASLLKQREKGDDPDNEAVLARAYEAKGMRGEAENARQRAAQFQNQH